MKGNPKNKTFLFLIQLVENQAIKISFVLFRMQI